METNKFFRTVANKIPQLERGKVWCTVCSREQQIDSGSALKNGWPKCCGYTMTIDSPEERAAEIGAELATLREQFARLQDMEYAVEAGNTEREDVPADVLKAWFRYVHTGERESNFATVANRILTERRDLWDRMATHGHDQTVDHLRERVAELEALAKAANALADMVRDCKLAAPDGDLLGVPFVPNEYFDFRHSQDRVARLGDNTPVAANEERPF